MKNHTQEKSKIKNLVKLLIYLIVITISFILSIVALYYNWTIAFQILFGIFTGSIISLLTIPNGEAQDKTTFDASEDLLNFLEKLKTKEKYNGIKIFDGIDDGELNLSEMLKNAKERIWILGVDLSKFLMRYKDELLHSEQNGCNLRFLAMHPHNVYAQSRYRDERLENAEEMYKSLSFAVKELKNLKEKFWDASKFSAKLYLSQPTVILYIVDDKLIISHILCPEKSENNAKTDKSALLLCDMNACETVDDDFINSHFNKIWEEADEIENFSSASEYTATNLGADGAILRFNVKPVQSNVAVAAKTARRRIGAFFSKHAKPLAFPILSSLVALIVLGLVVGGVINSETELFINAIVGTVLGFLSSAVLTIIIYVYDTVSKAKDLKERQSENDAKFKILTEGLQKLSNRPLTNGGITLYRNRNDVAIKEKILNARKRVYIYATNHRYIESLGVAKYLCEQSNEIDVRFLMLNPESIFVATRFHEIPGKDAPQEFADEITGNLSVLYNEYGKNKNVQLKLFVKPPTFMLYIIDDLLIVSYILRQGRATDQSIFCFDLSNPKVRMHADDFIGHFNSVWESGVKFDKKLLKRLNKLNGNRKYLLQPDERLEIAEIQQGN